MFLIFSNLKPWMSNYFSGRRMSNLLRYVMSKKFSQRVISDSHELASMTDIIYQYPGEDEEYLIDEDAQQLLAYLYLYGPSPPSDLIDYLKYQNKEEVIITINKKLSENNAGLIRIRNTNQSTLWSAERDYTQEIEITKDGKRFVKKFRHNISPPLSVHSFIQEMKQKERDIEEALRKIVYKLENYDEDHDIEEIEGMMARVEDSFDEIRNKQV
jgi:hypothetical protein